MQSATRKKCKEKGFTLLELLIVIAVIGILSSLIMVSLSTSRAKASDAAIKSDLRSLMNVAELYYVNNGNQYGAGGPGVCPAVSNGSPASWAVDFDPNFKKIAEHASIQAGGGDSGGGLLLTNCAINSQSWVIAVVLKSSNMKAWCVDSSGNSKEESLTVANNPVEAFSLVGSTYTCD